MQPRALAATSAPAVSPRPCSSTSRFSLLPSALSLKTLCAASSAGRCASGLPEDGVDPCGMLPVTYQRCPEHARFTNSLQNLQYKHCGAGPASHCRRARYQVCFKLIVSELCVCVPTVIF